MKKNRARIRIVCILEVAEMRFLHNTTTESVQGEKEIEEWQYFSANITGIISSNKIASAAVFDQIHLFLNSIRSALKDVPLSSLKRRTLDDFEENMQILERDMLTDPESYVYRVSIP